MRNSVADITEEQVQQLRHQVSLLKSITQDLLRDKIDLRERLIRTERELAIKSARLEKFDAFDLSKVEQMFIDYEELNHLRECLKGAKKHIDDLSSRCANSEARLHDALNDLCYLRMVYAKEVDSSE